MPPPDSTGSRAPEAAGGKGTAPIPPPTQGTAFPKQLAALSSALREPAESRIARAMAQMQVPAKAPSTRDAEARQRTDETVAHFARQQNEQRDKVKNLAGLSSKMPDAAPPARVLSSSEWIKLSSRAWDSAPPWSWTARRRLTTLSPMLKNPPRPLLLRQAHPHRHLRPKQLLRFHRRRKRRTGRALRLSRREARGI
jgi:hypothetical protein